MRSNYEIMLQFFFVVTDFSRPREAIAENSEAENRNNKKKRKISAYRVVLFSTFLKEFGLYGLIRFYHFNR